MREALISNITLEKLSLRSHEIRVIDFEILWRTKWRGELYSKRQVFEKVSKIHKEASINVIRPGFLRFSHLDYWSIVFSHGREIARQLREFKPDIVVGFGILNTYLSMRLAKRRHIPFVYYLIDSLHTLVPFKPYHPIARAIERKTLQGADNVLAINEELRNYAIGIGAEPSKTIVIRAGVDFKRFNPRINGDEIRRLYGFRREDVVLLFIGWLYPFSGLREVVLELAKKQEEYSNLRVLVVGEGDLFPELKAMKERYALKQLVLAGRRPYDEIPSFISASDICLLPAHRNITMRNIVPIKMYEYMACGKPVISTKLPGIVREFGFDSGIVYVDRPEDVLSKVTELLGNARSIRERRIKALQFVEEYSWDKISDDFEGTLETTIRMKVKL